ncbi:uncharacterized protein N7518_007018 [Penicillium psychrosexuale]|uniref:uncharacterized protein n=1 Tax=Penicillium psychrosexuale TaxID=1002107 RepID=UPI0025458008|nr:uncharacterized protein N7518_007018 [Penicillium psychrosexuale]KAJ5790007.1 hypothetical protein N7518_007018 [Penicillium psychrosexuale]
MSTISALKYIIRRFIEHKIDTKDLETILDTPMPLAVASLTLQDVQKILGLTLVVDNEFDFVAPVPIPPDLKLWLEKSDRAHGASRDEALIRCKLNLLLVCAHDLVLSFLSKSARSRKELGKADTTVYGISTDTMTFTFMKLDNESRWSYKIVGVVGNGFEQVLGLLVYLMGKAASVSPATSKRTSCRTQEGSWESDLIFDCDPEMDVETDVEMDE